MLLYKQYIQQINLRYNFINHMHMNYNRLLHVLPLMTENLINNLQSKRRCLIKIMSIKHEYKINTTNIAPKQELEIRRLVYRDNMID